MQVPRWLPILSELQYHYGKHTYFANVAIDTLAALIAALLVFAGLPAMDLILGQDPGTGQEVSAFFHTWQLFPHMTILKEFSCFCGLF